MPLPDEAPLIKRRRGDHASGARRLALDCHLLYSFITGSVSTGEIKEIFSKSLTAANLQTEFGGVQQSPSHTHPCRRGSGAGLPISPMATPSQSGKTPPVLLYDTLAEMKADILSFKNDQRSDFDALQKQLDGLSTEPIVPHFDQSVDVNNKVLALELQIQECVSKIKMLDAQLCRRTNRISDLESDIKIVKGENTVLRHMMEQSGKDLGKAVKDMKSLEGKLRKYELACSDWEDKCSSKHKTLSSKVRDLRSNDTDTNIRLKSIQIQLDNLKEPEFKKQCSVKNDLKGVKDKICAINDDLYVQDKVLKDNTAQVNSIKKKQTEMVKEHKRFQKNYSCTLMTNCSNSEMDKTVHYDKQAAVRSSTSSDRQTKGKQTESNGTINDKARSTPFQNHVVKDTGPTDDRQAHDQHVPGTIPVHMTSRPMNGANPGFIEHFYIGNVGTHVQAHEIANYLQNNKVTVRSVQILPHKAHNCNGAKITVLNGHRQDILSQHYFPGKDIYARPWYPAKGRKLM